MRNLAVDINGLCLDFFTIKALDNISMKIEKGTVFGYLGANGSGKTTTIKVLLGLLKPLSGNATVLGYNVVNEADKIRKNSGVLLEHHGLYESLSAEDNLEYYGRIAGLAKSDRKERIYELLMNIELWERRKEKVGGWSKGMKQKLAITRSLLHRPSLIFLDEPTSGLDPVSAVAFRNDLINIVRKEGITAFLTTHNLEEAEKICDHIGVLKNGRLIALGSQKELKEQNGKNSYEIHINDISLSTINNLKTMKYADNITYNDGVLIVDLRFNDTIAPVVAKLVDSGVEINIVNKTQPSLEQVYLTLMEKNDNRRN